MYSDGLECLGLFSSVLFWLHVLMQLVPCHFYQVEVLGFSLLLVGASFVPIGDGLQTDSQISSRSNGATSIGLDRQLQVRRQSFVCW